MLIEKSYTSYEKLKNVVPSIIVDQEDESYTRLTVQPLMPGWGISLGNLIRRVLLSSLEGAAITWVRIESVHHEFSTVPHMKEDVLEFLLNVKGIRIRPNSQRNGRLRLDVSGTGEVKAGDIMASADFEIVNPEHYLASLDSPQAALTAEFNVEIGIGYQKVDQDDTVDIIGTIPIDAVFTPILQATYSVTKVRVEDRADYDKLTIEVWTDRTISPVDAVKKAAKIATDQMTMFIRIGEEPQSSSSILSPDIANKKLEDMDLSARTQNSLSRAKILTVGEVLALKPSELMKVHNFGKKSYDELIQVMTELGYMKPTDSMSEQEYINETS